MEYNAVIRQWSGRSMKIVDRVLISNLKDIPTDWLIKYGTVTINRMSTEMKDLCCGPMNPLQIYKPILNSFQLCVRNVFGQTVNITVTGKDTIEIVKWKIFQSWGTCHPIQQRLFIGQHYNEKKLKRSQTLSSYKITGESTIYLKTNPEFSFGVPFKAIDVETTYPRIETLTDSPSWARFSSGLNICGTCPNLRCISRKMRLEVVIRVGFGMVRIIQGRNAFVCTACNESLLFPDKYLFSNARALVHYRRAEGDPVRTQLVEATDYESRFHELYLGHSSLLEIQTVEPWKSPFMCAKCDNSLLFAKHEYKLPCGHIFHDLCKPSQFFKRCKLCK